MIEIECIRCGAKALFPFFIWGYLCQDCTDHYEEGEIADINRMAWEIDREIINSAEGKD